MVERPVSTEKLLVFGDLCLAVLGDVRTNVLDHKVTFIFRPTDYMRWKHNIKDEDYDETLFWIKKSYDMRYCVCIDPNPDFQRWFLACDYYGNPTDMTKMLDQNLLADNESLVKERDALSKQLVLLRLKFNEIIKYPEEWKTEFLEELEKQKKVLGDYIPTEKSGESNE